MKTGVPTPQVAPIRAEDLDVDATILICTYNRADDLERTLESLALSAAAGFSWDVLVVDNNSNDRTHDVVEARIASFPVRLRYLFEPRQGKSNALNTGMNAAHAAIIVFTDDDVVVETGWLQAAVQPLLKRRDIGYTGGPVRPIWKASRPSWLDEEGNLGGAIAVMDHGPSSFVFEEQKKTPLGVNMAVRRDVIERIGGFRPSCRSERQVAARPGTGGVLRSREAGIRGLYVPAMVLNHVGPGLAAHPPLLPALVVVEGRLARARPRHARPHRAGHRAAERAALPGGPALHRRRRGSARDWLAAVDGEA